jgi:DNA ligase-4
MASSQREPDAEALEDEERQYGHSAVSNDADEL